MISAIASALTFVITVLPLIWFVSQLWKTLETDFRSVAASRVTKEDRAKAYLHHVLVLTGATKMGIGYALNVGQEQFQLWDRFVRRLKNPKDPRAPYEETCFFILHSGMPRAEEIATVLLQLSSNPSLFDKWALQKGVAYKADGRMFEHTR